MEQPAGQKGCSQSPHQDISALASHLLKAMESRQEGGQDGGLSLLVLAYGAEVVMPRAAQRETLDLRTEGLQAPRAGWGSLQEILGCQERGDSGHLQAQGGQMLQGHWR